jgi:hypothetical protein
LWRLAKPPISVGFLQLINNNDDTNKKKTSDTTINQNKTTTVARNGSVIETTAVPVTIEAEIEQFVIRLFKFQRKQLSTMGNMLSSMTTNFPARFVM